MQVVGITGTNGKTTTAYLLRAVFEAAGKKCGLLGTVTYSVGDQELPASRTTPEAPDVQRMFRQMVDAGCGACVMEVSSHALALRRVDETRFAAGVFTNLTRDHLDYHGDMESYFAAKKRLFEMLPRGRARRRSTSTIRAARRSGKSPPRPVTYAINKPADVTPGPLIAHLRRPRIRRAHAEGQRPREVEARRPARMCRTSLRPLRPRPRWISRSRPSSAGSPASTACPAASRWCPRPSDDVTVVIDYAHTDDALKNLLETARPLAQRRVITLFGCGGDRDRTKRPLMGAVAARLSDIVVLTSDNPRTRRPRAHHRGDQARRSAASDRDDTTALCHRRSQGSDSVRDQESRAGRSGAARREGARKVADHRQTRSCRLTKRRSRARRWSGDADAGIDRCCDRRTSFRAGERAGDRGLFDRHADHCAGRRVRRDSRRSFRRQRVCGRGGAQGRGRRDRERRGL